jgi:hypothetical protein
VDRSAAVISQGTILAAMQIDHVQVLVAYERHVASARGNLRVDEVPAAVRQLPHGLLRRSGIEVVQIELPAERKQQTVAIRGPAVGENAVIGGRAFAFAPRLLGIRQLLMRHQAPGVDQQPRAAGFEIELPQIELELVVLAAAQKTHAIAGRCDLYAPGLFARQRRIIKQPVQGQLRRHGRHSRTQSQQRQWHSHSVTCKAVVSVRRQAAASFAAAAPSVLDPHYCGAIQL